MNLKPMQSHQKITSLNSYYKVINSNFSAEKFHTTGLHIKNWFAN